MNMQFYVLSRLLKSSTGLCCSGYVLFVLSTIDLVFNGSFSGWLITLVILNLVLCAAHHYMSIRVQFDVALLEMLFDQSQQHSIESLTDDLDRSLLALNLITQQKTARSWDLRFKGCLKIFKIQVMILALQCIAFITILAL